MSYKDGQLDGPGVGFYLGMDQKAWKVTYSNGELHGPYVSWHRSGTKLMTCAYSHGRRDGRFRLWKADGSLEAKGSYKSGVMTSVSKPSIKK